MPNKPPEISLSSDDRRLLVLLARLITDETPGTCNFVQEHEIVLSNAEAAELVYLLNEFADSRRFRDSAEFVEQIFSASGYSDSQVREIYLQWRKRNGRTRALASTHWQEFLVRLGQSKNRGGYYAGSPIIQARRMDVYKFLELEKKLLEHSNLTPTVRALVMRVIGAHASQIEAVRNGDSSLPANSLKGLPQRVSREVEIEWRSATGPKPMSTQKLVGLITVVIDMSAIFTTRDWNVVGTISSMAGALVAASTD
jgi:hypothetical protein